MRLSQQDHDFWQNVLVPLSCSGLSEDNLLVVSDDSTFQDVFAQYPAFLEMTDKALPSLRQMRYLENFGFNLIFLQNHVIVPQLPVHFYPDPSNLGGSVASHNWVVMAQDGFIKKVTFGIDEYHSRKLWSKKVTDVSVMRLETSDDSYYTVPMPLLDEPRGQEVVVSKLESISKYWRVDLQPRRTVSRR